MRLEINTAARKGDILNEDNELVQRVAINKSLSESDSVDEWYASLDQALARAGYAGVDRPAVTLPLTVETAVDRYTIRLDPLAC